jgi:hypothetical protein
MDTKTRTAVCFGTGCWILAAALSVTAQQPQRRAANVAALLAYPGFYHLRQVVAVGKVTLRDSGDMWLDDEAGSLRVVFKGSPPDDLSEVRGEFWDIGRLNPDDPRLSGYDLRRTFGMEPEASWPRPGQVTAIIASAVSPTSNPVGPSIRSLVLFPSRYLDQKITITGQFAGRNLLGDLPDAPSRSRYDFVLRSADAAVWVVNIRPRGRDFELALDARIDTGRWLQVSGTVQQGRGLQWIEATEGTLTLATAPVETAVEEIIRVPAGPPPDVVFSAPIDGETEVSRGTNVRVQFSRDIEAATFKGRVRVSYAASEVAPPADPDSASVPFTTQYLPGTRVLEIRFPAPLEGLRTVRVELLEGIAGTDQQRMKPWALSFMTGGS